MSFFTFSTEAGINVEAGAANKYSWTACYITPWRMLSMVSSSHPTLSTLSSLSRLWASLASRRWQLIMSDWRPAWSVIPLNAWAAVHSLVPLRSYPWHPAQVYVLRRTVLSSFRDTPIVICLGRQKLLRENRVFAELLWRGFQNVAVTNFTVSLQLCLAPGGIRASHILTADWQTP